MNNNVSMPKKRCQGFGRGERLKKNFEFRRTLRKGTSYRDGVFILSVFKNEAGCHRLGVSIGSSKLPLASKRNHLKRLIREVFRTNKSELRNGPYDILVAIGRPPDCKVDYSTVEKRLLILLKKAKAL